GCAKEGRKTHDLSCSNTSTLTGVTPIAALLVREISLTISYAVFVFLHKNQCSNDTARKSCNIIEDIFFILLEQVFSMLSYPLKHA
ncbi:hypothetical protein J6590_047178, partial [Homalodisca vitripennis]